MSSLDEENEEISQIKEEIKRSRERETDFRQKILSYEDGAESEDKGNFHKICSNLASHYSKMARDLEFEVLARPLSDCVCSLFKVRTHEYGMS